MIHSVNLLLFLNEIEDNELILKYVSQKIGVSKNRIQHIEITRKSLDARKKEVKYNLQLRVYVDEAYNKPLPFTPILNNVHAAVPIAIIGAGPAGLFAALHLISIGYKPVIFERGKDVRNRRRDLAKINREGIVNPESNYCFGEGGAGTYSDGKLYTRSTKRGDVQHVLNLFVYFGADSKILIEAHPHIGTNKLPDIITSIRNQIIDCGGEVHFEKKVVDLTIKDDKIEGLTLHTGEALTYAKIILATGHSARDIFELLDKKGILIESKPFALGVRIEHPQTLIDSIQYHCNTRSEGLPPASYSLVSQECKRGVFSFCMCPGGIIAPAATDINELVVNGWSPSKRNNPFSNSGLVVSVDERDFAKYGFKGKLAAMQYQQMVEQKSFIAGGGKLVAPAQSLVDFTNKKVSTKLPTCSYLPGVNSVSLWDDVLPFEVADALRNGLISFGKKMKGYFTNDAILVATESRTSSPIRIPRDTQTLEHVQIKGLFPCAEGAGYAGGIVSAAIDGIRCAQMATIS